MTFDLQPTTFREGWVSQNLEVLTLKYELTEEQQNLTKEKLYQLYDSMCKAPKVSLVNNYKGLSVGTNFEVVADRILSQQVILGGDGVLFKQHENMLSFLVPIITELQAQRSAEKKTRDKYEKGTPEWLFHNRNQNNKKVVINALYGLFGYSKFRFFNVNLAQAVTAMGQNIISTATCAFENFLSDNAKFLNTDEAILYITRIASECKDVENAFPDVFAAIKCPTMEELVSRVARRTYHVMSQEDADYVVDLLSKLTPNQKKLVYYKNNFMEFLDVPAIRDLLGDVLSNIEELKLGEMYAFDKPYYDNPEKYNVKCTPEAKGLMQRLLDILDAFVLSTHQIFDRVRRTKYTKKKSVLYIDTDSNFIGLGKFINLFAERYDDIYHDETQFIFKSASIMTIIMSMVIRRTYEEFTDDLNISKEYAYRLNMKNEFLFSILLFGLVKKRYIGKMIIQEGKIIKGGKGDIEVKGFDFKKAGTKKEIYNQISDIINTTILDVKQINMIDVYKAADKFKLSIREDIMAGSNIYYKQLSVSKPDKYKNPYSMQGIKGVMVWNAIMTDNKMELPAEVDIIPITLDTGITTKRFREEFLIDPEQFFIDNPKLVTKAKPMYDFMHNYPVEFQLLLDNFMRDPDHEWKTPPKSIAKPRNLIDLPPWLVSIIDIESIEANNVNLINPILESLGSVLLTSKAGPMYSTVVKF
jgi:hypothetical protein